MLVNGNSERIALTDKSVHCVVTSPPYFGLRDYGLLPSIWDGSADCRHVWGEEHHRSVGRSDVGREIGDRGGNYQEGGPHQVDASRGQFCRHCNAWRGCLGLEPTTELYVAHLVQIFREIRRVLRNDGTCWLNLGDKMIAKQLLGIPWRVALALQADGWYLRRDIIWAKGNGMPESVTDRPTLAHEYLFLLTIEPKYYYDLEAVKEPSRTPMDSTARQGFGSAKGKNNTNERAHSSEAGTAWEKTLSRNLRTVWTIATEPYGGAHFATFPKKFVEPCIKAGTSQRGCCPACGAGWVRVVEKEFIHQQDVSIGRGFRGAPDQKTLSDNENFHNWDGVPRGTNHTATTGWRPACDCDADDPVPAIVLDPFAGSGTVGEVCRNLRRRFVGIDLSADYLAKNALPRAERKTAAVALTGLPLFEGIKDA